MAVALLLALHGVMLAPRPPALLAACRCPHCGTSAHALSSDRPEEPKGASAYAIQFLRWYKQTISPLLPPGCRFIPTCSEYAMQSFKQFDVPQATVLTAWRLIRCNPTGGFGVDEPCWPPPAYWAGSRRVRTPVDDQVSKSRAMKADGGDDDDDDAAELLNLPRL